MRITRRSLLAGSFAPLLPLSLTGCNPTKNPTLRFSNWQQIGDDSQLALTLGDLYEQFKSENDIDLQVESIPGGNEYVTKTLLSVIAHSAPDVMQLDASSAAAFIDNGALSNLKSDNEFNWEDFFPNIVNITRRSDDIFALPLDFTPMVVYYNRSHFQKAGLPEPNLNITWTQFLEYAKVLTRDNRYGFAFTNWMPGWIMWLWNNHGDVLDTTTHRARGTFDSDQNIETVTWLRDLVTKHEVAPSLSQMAALGADPFANGDASMTVSGHWSMVAYQQSKAFSIDDIGIIPMPHQQSNSEPDSVASQTVVYESGLAIDKSSTLTRPAKNFIKLMTSYEAQSKIQQTGLAVCARIDVAKERAKNNPLEQRFLDIVPTGRAPWGASVQGYDFVETTGQNMMDAVLKSGEDPKAALRAAAQTIDRYFEEKSN